MKISTSSHRFSPVSIALAAFALALFGATPASARSAYVQDGAGMFKPATVSSLNSTISDLQRATGKEIVVVTVPSLNDKSIDAAAEQTFSQQQVNGVLFFFAKAEKKDLVVGDRASRSFFPQGSFQDVATAMRGDLRAGDPDSAITTGVRLVSDTYRGHVGARRSGYEPSAVGSTHQGGFGFMGILFLILGCVVVFMIVRAIIRAVSGPRMMPPGYGQQGGFGGPGFGGPGYGGYGGGGGGGSFFSGLLGGLGGAFLGNELFGRHDNFGDGGQNAGFGDNGGGGASNDTSGFQSDPGQADMGGAGGGDWGGGGGGGDFGGGGGDSGGGW